MQEPAPSPTPLQDGVDRLVDDVTPLVALRLIARKFAEQGVRLKPAERQRLTDLLRAGTGLETFQPDHRRGNRSITIVFSQADLDGMAEEGKKLARKLGRISTKEAGVTADRILENLRARWPAEMARQRDGFSGFRDRLFKDWQVPFSAFGHLITVFRESGAAMTHALAIKRGNTEPFLVDTLQRLHLRACQVALEVQTLIESGFADGANARWRTLHEITITAMFIQEHGETTARSYVDHQVVESWRAVEHMVANRKKLKERIIPKRDRDRLKRRFDALIVKYLKPFGGQYGWAAAALGNPNCGFKHIEANVEVGHFRSYYQLASHSVHANPKGAFFTLASMEQSHPHAGATNFGFSQAGQNASISLYQFTVALMMANVTTDAIVSQRLVQVLSKEAGAAFVTTQSDLHERYSKAESAQENDEPSPVLSG